MEKKINENAPLVDQLGFNVTLEKEGMSKDQSASEVFHRIGKAKAEPGMEYVGTIAVHCYMENMAVKKASYSIANVTHISMIKDISEALVATIMNNATIDIRTHFNPQYKYKTNRKGDRRGSVK